MAPERWRQIEDLYHAVLEHGRAALAEADPELRREVESLLAENGTLPAIDAVSQVTQTQITSGTMLGAYRIEGPLGAGGMGEVFRGRDTRLERAVAIKFLSRGMASDLTAVERFRREAKAISALNHPHICTLYDVGPNYLVMELVEGETLAERLKRGKLSLDDTLRYGAQIADAIGYAHAKGIIHRDIKPGNIMLTKAGVQVLDFGLAKSHQDETLTLSRAVMGTPAYMAPEQREGKECDARSDIYSLGLMLYEMTTGQRLRDGQTPELSGAAPALRQIIQGSLEPDPDARWQSAYDIRKQLLGAKETAATATGVMTPASAPTERSRFPRWLPWALTGLACAALAVALAAFYRRDSLGADLLPSEFTITLEKEMKDHYTVPIPSPDGRFLAFAGDAPDGSSALWVRPLASLDAKPLPGTEGTDGAILWSPDGKWIAFHAAGKLKKVSPAGGPPQTIGELRGFQDAAWGSHGDIIFRASNREPLFQIRDSGGPVQPLTSLDRGLTENSHRYPRFLDDGKHFLYVTRCGDRENNSLYEGLLGSTERKRVMHTEAQVFFIPAANGRTSELLFYRDGAVVAQTFDAASAKVEGEPETVLDAVDYSPPSIFASFQASRNGRVIVGSADKETESRLVWFLRNGQEAGTAGPPGEYVQPRLAPGGDRVAYAQPDPQTGNRDIWFTELTRGITTRLTNNVANDWHPVWSPDGRQILFGSDRDGGTLMMGYLKASLDTAGPETRVANVAEPYDWSRDGRWISYGESDVFIAPASGDAPAIPFANTAAKELNGRFSPDTKWIAYSSNENGRFEIYARPFAGVPPPATAGRVQISDHGGEFPVWGPEGKELYYMGTDGTIYAVDTRNLGHGDTVPPPVALFRACPSTRPQTVAGNGTPYQWSFDTLDGQRFLTLCKSVRPGKFTILTNWEQERNRGSEQPHP